MRIALLWNRWSFFPQVVLAFGPKNSREKCIHPIRTGNHVLPACESSVWWLKRPLALSLFLLVLFPQYSLGQAWTSSVFILIWLYLSWHVVLLSSFPSFPSSVRKTLKRCHVHLYYPRTLQTEGRHPCSYNFHRRGREGAGTDLFTVMTEVVSGEV